jgi:hypothetical protein
MCEHDVYFLEAITMSKTRVRTQVNERQVLMTELRNRLGKSPVTVWRGPGECSNKKRNFANL